MLGRLQIEGVNHPPIWTLEDKWLNNQSGVSCIPSSTYQFEPWAWNHAADFPKTWKLQNVPKRSDILIHWGNWHTNTRGCILVGMGLSIDEKTSMVTNSKKAIDILRSIIGQKGGVITVLDGCCVKGTSVAN